MQPRQKRIPSPVYLPLIGALLIADQAATAQPSLRISTGYEYTEGNYGSDIETRQHSLPLSISWKQDTWTLSASSYGLRTDGPADIISVDGSPTGSSAETAHTTQRSTQQGIGDTTLRLRKELPWGAEQGIFFDLNAAVRLATASSSAGILHRDPDYTLQLDSFAPLGDWMPMLSIGYKWMGSGDNFTPDNVWLTSAGLQYQINKPCAGGAIFDYRQRLTSRSEPLQEVMSYMSCKVDTQWSITGYLLNGFSDSSVDQGFGLQISWRKNQQ